MCNVKWSLKDGGKGVSSCCALNSHIGLGTIGEEQVCYPNHRDKFCDRSSGTANVLSRNTSSII